MTTPKKDGFYMPGEYEKHKGCILVWPERPGSWVYGAVAARKAFKAVISGIAQSETVYLAASHTSIENAREMLSDVENVIIFECDTNDSWARDIAPTGVVNADRSEVRAVNWEFNAWGGDFDGLYTDYELDNAFAFEAAKLLQQQVYDAAPFVLEGGSIHSDGEGTILVTESCLLSKGRNPELSKEEIEEKLKEYLGAEKVLWLPRGIYNDETNEHVDNFAAFLRPGEILLAWTDDENDPQYELSLAGLRYLEKECDAKGRKLIVHKMPIPDHPVLITEEDLAGYTFADGEENREVGERLAASYVNFYFSNEHILLPQFGGENEESDKRAVEILSKLCPERTVIPVYARDILVGGGNIHCITQQIPAGATL